MAFRHVESTLRDTLMESGLIHGHMIKFCWAAKHP